MGIHQSIAKIVDLTTTDEMIANKPSSNPPQGSYKVKNFWVDAETGRLVVEYDDTPTP